LNIECNKLPSWNRTCELITICCTIHFSFRFTQVSGWQNDNNYIYKYVVTLESEGSRIIWPPYLPHFATNSLGQNLYRSFEYFDSFFEISELHKVLLPVVLKGSASFQYDVIHTYVSIDGLYGFLYVKPVFSSREGYWIYSLEIEKTHLASASGVGTNRVEQVA
jgi:hypothetical protein